MNSTSLGKAKVYFTKKDFGKMLKLKDISNLYIGEINKDYGTVEVEVITTMDNITNNRVKDIFKKDMKINYNVDIHNGKQYYLSFDVSREGTNYGVLFEENEQSELKIIKFIKINEDKLTNVADKLIEILKILDIYDNTKIIVPTFSIGKLLVDYLREKEFNNILELDLDDIRKCGEINSRLIENKDNLFRLIPDNLPSVDMVEFIKMSKELDNIELQVSCGRIVYKKKSIETSSTRICGVFYALTKLNYKL